MYWVNALLPKYCNSSLALIYDITRREVTK